MVLSYLDKRSKTKVYFSFHSVIIRKEDGDIPTVESHWLQQIAFPASNMVITAGHFQDCLPAMWCWLDRGCIPGITTRENNDGVKMASTLQILQSAVESIPASAELGRKQPVNFRAVAPLFSSLSR